MTSTMKSNHTHRLKRQVRDQHLLTARPLPHLQTRFVLQAGVLVLLLLAWSEPSLAGLAQTGQTHLRRSIQIYPRILLARPSVRPTNRRVESAAPAL